MTAERMRAASFARRLDLLTAVREQLRADADVDALLAAAAGLAPRVCGFERALIVGVEPPFLTADVCGRVAHVPSDRLRRLVLANPIRIERDTVEGELTRSSVLRAIPERASALAAQLALAEYELAPIAPETEVLAILVVDRSHGPVAPHERAVVKVFASLVAAEIQRRVLDTRLARLTNDLRQMATSAQALTSEVRRQPIALPAREPTTAGLLFSATSSAPPERLADVLTDREMTIVGLLAQGCSNREIAEQIALSRETVKAQVARILRKLGAANRTEAAARYVALRQRAG